MKVPELEFWIVFVFFFLLFDTAVHVTTHHLLPKKEQFIQ